MSLHHANLYLSVIPRTSSSHDVDELDSMSRFIEQMTEQELRSISSSHHRYMDRALNDEEDNNDNDNDNDDDDDPRVFPGGLIIRARHNDASGFGPSSISYSVYSPNAAHPYSSVVDNAVTAYRAQSDIDALD